MTTSADTFEGWGILELFGHRRLAGYLSEQEIAGGKFLRIDIPDQATQYYGASAIYGITPTDEDTARQVATLSRPAPVQRWELPTATVTVDDVDEADPYERDLEDAGEDLEDEETW